MKKTTLQLLIILLSFGSASLAYAQNADNEAGASVDASMSVTTAKPKSTVKEELKNIQQEIASSTEKLRNEVKEAKEMRAENASTTAALREALKNKILKRFNPMTDRMEATIVREEMIMTKLVSRISKIQSAGGNTDLANKYLLQAQDDLKAARVSLDSIKNLLSTQATQGLDITMGTTTTTKAALVNLRKAAANLEKNIRDAHNALNKVVQSLRSNQGKNASTTDKVEVKTQVNANNQ